MSVSEQTIWQLALPAAGFLGLAALIGPLVIAIACSALALGAALSAGAVAAALFFPLLALMGLSVFAFGGLTFGTFAAVGLGVVIPKLMSMVGGSPARCCCGWVRAGCVLLVCLRPLVPAGGAAMAWLASCRFAHLVADVLPVLAPQAIAALGVLLGWAAVSYLTSQSAALPGGQLGQPPRVQHQAAELSCAGAASWRS